MAHGPVEVLFLTMPPTVGVDAPAAILRPPVESGVIRIIDCVLMVRGRDEVSMRDLEDEGGLPTELLDLDIDANDLLSSEDLADLAAGLAPEQAGLAIVYEQLWARDALVAVEEVGAEVGLYLRIPPDEVEAAFAAAV